MPRAPRAAHRLGACGDTGCEDKEAATPRVVSAWGLQAGRAIVAIVYERYAWMGCWQCSHRQ